MKAKTHKLIENLNNLGFSYDEAISLRSIEMTLQRWGEMECGDSNDYCSTGIERDETTGKPFRVVSYHNDPAGKVRRYPVPDREKGALARLAKIMAAHPALVAYHQTDCRGCNLYILRRADIPDGSNIDSIYTRGLAVCD